MDLRANRINRQGVVTDTERVDRAARIKYLDVIYGTPNQGFPSFSLALEQMPS